jgi:hypothetical protein
MNSVLEQIYGLDKTAAESGDELTLNDVSAADLLAAHASGEVDINDYLPASDEGEKTAGDDEEGFDLSSLSDEELQAALAELDGSEKIASEEAAYWDAAGRQMAHGYADELTKQASMENTMDLNELSAEEIIGLAYELSDEMNKTADEHYYEEDEIDLNAMTPDEIIELAYHLESGIEDETEKVAGIDLNELSVDEFMGFAAELEDEFEMEKEAAKGGKVLAMLRDAAMAKQFRGGLAGRKASKKALFSAEKARAMAGNKGKSNKMRQRYGKAGSRLEASGQAGKKQSLKDLLQGGAKTTALYGGAGGSLIAAGRASKR